MNCQHEVRVSCHCSDPFDQVVFRYSDDEPEIYIWFVSFHGNLWKRIKEAWKLIRSGYRETYPDIVAMKRSCAHDLLEFFTDASKDVMEKERQNEE